MKKPFELIKDSTSEFIFLFTNADEFYISSRRALLKGWVVAGCSNAHQAIELYVKAIVRLDNQRAKFGHDLIKLLERYKSKDVYFEKLLENEETSEFLKQLSESYLTHRYGQSGSISNSTEIISIIDDISYNLRSVYLRKCKFPSTSFYKGSKIEILISLLKERNRIYEKGRSSNRSTPLLGTTLVYTNSCFRTSILDLTTDMV